MPSTKSFIGVVVAVAGNITISLALNCQKLAHLRLQREGQGSDAGSPTNSKQHSRSEEGRDDDREDGQSQDEEEQNDEIRDTSHHRLAGKRRRDGTASSSTTTSSSGATSYTKRTLIDRDDGDVDGDRDDDDADRDRLKAADRDDSGDDGGNGGTSTKFIKSKLWWLGIALMTIGEGGNFISYGFAPASLVAPLGAVALLSNVIISPILLKEKFKAADIGGILLAIIGAVTVVFSSKQSDDRLGPDALLAAIKRLEFVVYASIAVGMGIFLAFLSRTRYAERWVLIDVGTCAVFGGFTVLSTKGISSLISGGQPIEALKYPITYVLVLVLAVTAVVQITYLNRALQRFDSREVIPTQFVLFTISAVVGSAILYRDFENTDANRLINFLFGCLTTFAGVFVLTRKKDDSDQNASSDDEYEDGEDGVDEQDRLLSRSWHGGDQRGERSTSRGRVAVVPVDVSSTSSNRKLIKVHTPSRLAPLPGRPAPTPHATATMTTGSVPFSMLASPRRQRSRTSSPSRVPIGAQASDLSRSAATSTGGLSTSIGLRTPRLGLINLDRPTGLSPGHYLLLATPPPPLNLNQPRAPSSYGSTSTDATPWLLPLHAGDVGVNDNAGGPSRVGKKRATMGDASAGRGAVGGTAVGHRHRRVKSRASYLSIGGESSGSRAAADDGGSDGQSNSAAAGSSSGTGKKKRRTSEA